MTAATRDLYCVNLSFAINLGQLSIMFCSKGTGPEAGRGKDRDVHGYGRRLEALWVSAATQTPQLGGPRGRLG